MPELAELRLTADFIKCYGKGIAFKDKGGRTFWMDPKWQQAAIDYFNGEA